MGTFFRISCYFGTKWEPILSSAYCTCVWVERLRGGSDLPGCAGNRFLVECLRRVFDLALPVGAGCFLVERLRADLDLGAGTVRS